MHCEMSLLPLEASFLLEWWNALWLKSWQVIVHPDALCDSMLDVLDWSQTLSKIDTNAEYIDTVILYVEDSSGAVVDVFGIW